jgi:hypothetical protein
VLKILYFAYHEAYECEMAKIGHEYYRICKGDIPRHYFGSRAHPPNIHCLDEVPDLKAFDLLLITSAKIFWQTRDWKIPKVIAFHTLLSRTDKKVISSSKGIPKVFISYSSFLQGKSGEGLVIYHSLDTGSFKGYEGSEQVILGVGNHILPRGEWNFKTFQSLAQGLPFKIVGKNPEMGEYFFAPDYEALLQEYRRNRLYLNTVEAPYNFGLLEAMATGMPVVTLPFGDLPLLIKDGVNGFISKDIKHLNSCIAKLMQDLDLARKIGAAGRETVKRLFSPQEFKAKWNHVFEMAKKIEV